MDIKGYMEQLNIPEIMYRDLENAFSYTQVEEGKQLLSMGEKSEYIYLILKGIVRGYYIDSEGNDITKCFSKEGEWCCFYNFLKEEPSSFYVETIEKCELAYIKTQRFKQLIDSHEALRKAYENLYREAFIKAEEKNTEFLLLDATQRYMSFVDKNPLLAKRVKQEYIASYLGVTPSSLSRIKRKL